MAAGTYKSTVAIIVTYQAVNCATGKTVTMDVYDESHAKDAPKCIAAMTEIGTTGRYYATFTPDAEGEWILIMANTTDANGKVVKAYAVCGQDVDTIGDTVATIVAKTNTIPTDPAETSDITTAHATTDGKVDAVDAKVTALGSPAMVG